MEIEGPHPESLSETAANHGPRIATTAQSKVEGPRIASREPTVKPPIICLVTAGRHHADTTLARIREAIGCGVTLVQIREPQLSDRELITLARQACEAAAGTTTQIVINDRLDIVLAAGAHGVHLRARSFSAARLRARTADRLVIGRSIHDADEAAAVERDGGCDYLVYGTVFPSRSKPCGHEAAGVAALHDVSTRVKLPVVAIGGITLANLADVRAAGAAGIAAIGLFDDAESMPVVVESVRRAFDTRSSGV